MPIRITLSRRAGWRLPKGAVSVARPHRFGNPILVADVAGQYPSLDDQSVARLVVSDFSVLARRGRLSFPGWRAADGQRGPVNWTYPSVEEIRTELRGKDLACWCKEGEPCHADVLLTIANEDPTENKEQDA